MTISIGDKFFDLEIIGKSSKKNHWVCECKCGNIVEIVTWRLTSKGNKSCGCRKRKAGGLSGAPEYQIWRHMLRRCYDKNDPAYKDYGGRGIRVCKRWRKSLKKFIKDLGKRPSSKHTLDRYPDNDGNYEPNNCRWSTKKEQARNRRSNRKIKWKGKSKTMKEWSEITGILYETIKYRLDKGYSVDQALTQRVRKMSKIPKGMTRKTVLELYDKLGTWTKVAAKLKCTTQVLERLRRTSRFRK